MSDILSAAPSTESSLNSSLAGLGTLTGTVGQDWYTAHNIFNPNSPQFASIQGPGGNVFGATVTQNQLASSVNSGIFGATGMGGFSPLMLLIILFVLIVIGIVIVKHI
jgi:hypothetical protein